MAARVAIHVELRHRITADIRSIISDLIVEMDSRWMAQTASLGAGESPESLGDDLGLLEAAFHDR